MRSVIFLVVLMLLSACASPEGPGALSTVSSGAQQQTQAQTAPLPGAVSSQTLAAPGAQTGAPQPLPTTQAEAIATAPENLNAGTLSASPPQQITLQDFATSDSGQTAANDPLATQSRPTFAAPENTSQETLAQAVQAGLQPQPAGSAVTAEAPQWPRVSLAPISTAPEPQATQLFDAIDDAAYRGGMQLAFFGDETAQFVVRSQVSAIPSDEITSVIYVFDIFDARGNLRHRVSGSRSIPRSGPDGWALIDETTTQLIADDVASRMLAWFQQNPI